MNIINILLKNQKYFGNIFDFKIDEFNSLPLDFTKNNIKLTRQIIEDTSEQEKYVFSLIKSENCKVGVGGYLEERVIYQKGEIFTNEGDPRFIHLGIDLWIEEDTPVYTPMDGEVYFYKNNKGFGDYGPTIFLKHNLQGEIFYSLYGHLNENSLQNLKVGEKKLKGEKLCEIGTYPINGHWAPHLHFQLITNLDDFNDGDYPAVCSQTDRDKFKMICPNPNLVLQIPNLP